MPDGTRIIPYKGRWPDIHPSVFIADGVVIVGDVVIEEEANIWFNTVIRGDVNSIRIGARSNVQDNSMLHVTWDKYSLTIGAGVTVGHSAVLHGCVIEDGSLIGMNATVLDGAVVGASSLVAAGSLVRQNMSIPAGSLVAGVPAKVVRALTGDESLQISRSADHYAGYVEEYRTHADMEHGMSFREYLTAFRR